MIRAAPARGLRAYEARDEYHRLPAVEKREQAWRLQNAAILSP